MQDVSFAYRFVEPNVSLQYSGTTTAQGLCRLESWQDRCDPSDTAQPRAVDFAMSGTAVANADYLLYPDLQLYPVLATAVVPIYNLGTVRGLTLSTTTLAQIYRGNITYWDDPRIVADNPNFTAWGLPPRQRIRVVVRADAAAVTQVWKAALASFDRAFAAQVPVDQSASWPNVTVVGKKGLLGMNAYVMLTPYSIGFSVLGDAVDSGLAVAQMQRNTGVVAASSISIEHAIMELGSSFGNDGNDSSRLTANLWNAAGLSSWPICNYVYIVVRKTTVRPGTTCVQMAANVAFWKWFLNADVVQNLAQKHSQGALPELVRNQVLARLVADMMCDGVTVDVEEQLTDVTGQGEATMEVLFNDFAEVYSLVDTSASVTYNATTNAAIAAQADPLARSTFVVSNSPAPNTSQDFSLAFAAVGVAVVSNYNLVLNGPTLAAILDGRITRWLDPAIVALNPAGLTDTSGANLTNRNQTIVLLRGPVGTVESLAPVLRSYDASYTGAAIQAATNYSSDSVAVTAVVGIPNSLAITTLTGSYSSQVLLAQFQRTDGAVVSPAWTALQACATADTYNAASRTFALWTSSSTACYPLCQAAYLRVRQSRCNNVTDGPRTRTVAFVEWLFSGAAIDAALTAQAVAPLRTNALVAAANAVVLDRITCNPKAQPGNDTLVFIIIGVAVGVLALLGVVGGWWCWRSTKQMRAMRKQFSNDNVAQECAAAIARFDLDSVAWLNALPNPNKIQSSFIKIVRLLTEVKPFIPDQLLISLTGSREPEGEDRASCLSKSANLKSSHYRDDATSAAPSDCAKDNGRLDVRTPTSSRSSVHSPVRSKRSGYMPRHRGRDGAPRCAPEGGASHQQWAAKRGTYLYAKFGVRGPPGDTAVLDEGASVLSALVTLCKRNGATIDAVAHDTVAVHWGVSSNAPTGPLRATQTALEAQAIEEQVSEPFRRDFWLRIAIGFGTCHVATISAAGHRFFVVSGTEVGLPIEVVTANVHARCKCSVLLTPAVYHEVQFSFKCFPRLWLRDHLLWEPIQATSETGVADDEWMYELQKMDEKDRTQFGARALHRVFMMARNGDPPAAIRAAVAEMKQRYAPQMSSRDNASLEDLLSGLNESSLDDFTEL
eukprot:EG_transcript_1076